MRNILDKTKGVKHHARVKNINDPEDMGRIQVELIGFDERFNKSPWCLACVPIAGDGYGFWVPPQIDDEVWVELSADGQWLISGYMWTGRRNKPSAGTATCRVLVTPAGHRLKFDESGDVELKHQGGGRITLANSGTIQIYPPSGQEVHINGTSKGVIRTGDVSVQHTHQATCTKGGVITINPQTVTFAQGSETVMAGD